MKIITYATYKLVIYMDQKIEVPLWVRYIAIAPRQRGNNADLVGCSNKPTISARIPKWSVKRDHRMEVIGSVTNCTIKTSQEAYQTLRKLPE